MSVVSLLGKKGLVVGVANADSLAGFHIAGMVFHRPPTAAAGAT